MRHLIAALLLAESLARAFRLAQLLPALPGHDFVAAALIVAGCPVAALLFTSGWMLIARRPPAALIARIALLSSAVLVTLTVGFWLAPTMSYPWWRWQITIGYWLYATAASSVLGRPPN